MVEHLPVTARRSLDYFSPEELVLFDETLGHALRDVSCLVFWTGVGLERAKRWASEHKLPTLSIAMGALFSERDMRGARFGKSPKAWSKYMKGASCRFAEYACHGNRQVIVLTQPPPNIYSKREQSNYRDLEEPILKGAFGDPGTLQIDYVHPTVPGAANFQYQVWPIDKSSAWTAFFKSLLPKKLISDGMAVASTKSVVVVHATQMLGVVVQDKHDELRHEERVKSEESQQDSASKEEQARKKAEKKQQKAEVKLRETQRKKEAKRKQEELKQQKAREKNEANRKRAEIEQQNACGRKDAKRKRVEFEQQNAREKKEAKLRKVEIEQQTAREKKEAKRRKVEIEQQNAREKKEAKRRRVEIEQQKAREIKEGNRKRTQLEQQMAREKKEANRKRTQLEQQMAREKKEANEKKAEQEQQSPSNSR